MVIILSEFIITFFRLFFKSLCLQCSRLYVILYANETVRADRLVTEVSQPSGSSRGFSVKVQVLLPAPPKSLEKQKSELSVQIINEEMAKPTLSREQIIFWFHRFRKLNTSRLFTSPSALISMVLPPRFS